MTAKAKRPYPGLHPFDGDETDVFFGREEQTSQLLAKLDQNRFLAVVGPSGCGKSSLVRAGLVFNLHAGFMASAGARWRTAKMRPGRHPMRRLTESLMKELALGPELGKGQDAQGFLGATLSRGPLGLVEALRKWPLPPETNLLLLVDQFEEIFRFRSVEEKDEADEFVALMLKSAEQQEPSIYVVTTMRSDYIGDCGQFTGLPERVSESQFLTPRLTREQREEAIFKPARVCKGDVDQALVSRLLNETSNEPDLLPVLQHLLMRMWNRALNDRRSARMPEADARGPVLTLDHYTAVGGLKSALSNHANEAFGGLTVAQKRVAEAMFRQLCELGSGHLYTRRPTKVGEIAKVADVAPERIIEVADVFRGTDTSFIVPGQTEALDAETTLDISHESLIRQWDKLKEWAGDEAESAKTYLRLSGDAALSTRKQAPLWRTPGLEVAQDWYRNKCPNKDWARRYGGDFDLAMEFLEASEKAQKREREEKEAEQLEKEKILRERAEAQEQRANTALAGEAKVVALLSRQALRDGDNRTAIRVPLEMFARDSDGLKSLTGRSGSEDLVKVLLAPENALFAALYRPVGLMLQHQALVYSANFSDDGRLVVTVTDEGAVRVWDAATGKPIDEPIRVTGQGRWASFDPEGRRIVVAYYAPGTPEGTAAAIWDRREKRFIARLIGHETCFRPISIATVHVSSRPRLTIPPAFGTRKRENRSESPLSTRGR